MKKRKRKLDIKIIMYIIIFVIAIFNVVRNYSKNEKEDNQIDDISPEISLIGDSELNIYVGDEYIERYVEAIDNMDGNISEFVSIDSNVDTTKPGKYEVKYTVKDSSGNEAKIHRIVNVYNKLGNNGLPVLMYHFFYDENTSEARDGNWLGISKFEEQIKYLSENNYYFPSWDEVENYIDGKKNLPEKSIVLTVDDGDDSFFDLAVPVLQKYNITATSFVITYWYGGRVENKEKNVDYQSHSYDMHKSGTNSKGVMLSWDKNKINEDLTKSSEILGGANVFCYPFGQYNEIAINALKETGYRLAFTTKSGRVKPGISKYELPRVRVTSQMSLDSFIKKVE